MEGVGSRVWGEGPRVVFWSSAWSWRWLWVGCVHHREHLVTGPSVSTLGVLSFAKMLIPGPCLLEGRACLISYNWISDYEV